MILLGAGLIVACDSTRPSDTAEPIDAAGPAETDMGAIPVSRMAAPGPAMAVESK